MFTSPRHVSDFFQVRYCVSCFRIKHPGAIALCMDVLTVNTCRTLSDSPLIHYLEIDETIVPGISNEPSQEPSVTVG